ncbi:MAG TPA: oligosaccharide flippase family protein [Candidatus Limnocylindrales bacterium]|nr:oligosaccharide flippase family protein [Candidatus Limnocylindrales bacterium]
MSALKTFYRHSSHYLGGRVAVMMLGFISFPLFTRVFSVAEYGEMSLIMNTVLLLTVMSKFGFQHAVQRYYPEYASSPDPTALSRYYATLFYGTGFIALTLCALFLIAVPFGATQFLGITANGALMLALILVVVRSLRSMQMNLMQMENKTRLFNGVDILAKALIIATICFFLFFWKKSIFSFFLGTVIVETAFLLQYMPFLSRRGLLSIQVFNPEFFRSAVMFAFPLMTAEISWVVLDSGDRFFVQHYLGAQSLGFYAAAYGIATYLQDVMMAPLQLALFPICMKLWTNKGKAETQEFLSRSLDHFAMVAVGVVSVFMVASRDVIVLLASKKFQEAHRLIPYLVIGLVLSAVTVYFRPGLLIHKKASKIATATLGASILNVALNIALLPRIGLLGAAIATTVSYGAIVVFLAWESLRVLPFKIEWIAFVRYVVAGSAVAYAATYLPVQKPLLNAICKGTFVVTLYAAVLWVTDVRVRKLISRAYQIGSRQIRQLGKQPPVTPMAPLAAPAPAPVEEEIAVNQ